MRQFAGQAWSAYKNNLLVQDIVETAITTLGFAGAQALFSEMSPEEIAASAGVGVGAAIVGRPIGDRVGRMAGRYADKRFPEFSAEYGRSLDQTMAEIKQVGGAGADEILQAKMKHHMAEGRGPLEGMGSIMGRQYGDNAAQGLVALAAPLVTGRSQEEETEK